MQLQFWVRCLIGKALQDYLGMERRSLELLPTINIFKKREKCMLTWGGRAYKALFIIATLQGLRYALL